jgi:hypothetical protein
MNSELLKAKIHGKFGDVWFLEEYYEIESLDIVRGAWVVVVRAYIKNYIGGVICHHGLYMDFDGNEWLRWGGRDAVLADIQKLKARLERELIEI